MLMPKLKADYIKASNPKLWKAKIKYIRCDDLNIIALIIPDNNNIIPKLFADLSSSPQIPIFLFSIFEIGIILY